ncbi:hypothetical protein Ccrd_004644 [Cynara cardunculus var. scolymus]|uniref:Pectinesterase catalytic domain-containing protein n=1 Tax=Cynara cardunculus var. scolymus TaxID=59895 RepID=A0A118JVN2_CYNCS|nr:hypothetical protein Ccrd_004644 [Cynara cardunculus var. scolymus]
MGRWLVVMVEASNEANDGCVLESGDGCVIVGENEDTTTSIPGLICSFDAFQDTLYLHSNCQFYRDRGVTSTMDFIFGHSAVVLQNCKIKPWQPLPNQFVTITAQGKKDPNEDSGISIHKCDITPLDYLTAPTYLGRPWKDYRQL